MPGGRRQKLWALYYEILILGNVRVLLRAGGERLANTLSIPARPRPPASGGDAGKTGGHKLLLFFKLKAEN